MAKKKGLGQGVDLLFGDTEEKYFECDISAITPNTHQPRVHFDKDELDGLAESIRENGVIQPLIVTHTETTDRFELVAGERRLRASKLAGLKKVPVVLMKVNNHDTLLELALIENIQRTDLNPIEEAQAFEKLIQKFSYTQEDAAKHVGKNRSTVANILRLLKLPEHIKEDIIKGLLSEGHGRALIKLIDRPIDLQETRNSIIRKGLSVRQTEKIIQRLTSIHSTRDNSQRISEEEEIPDTYKRSLIYKLTNRLNSKVIINQNGSRGKIEIEYYSSDDLERLVALLGAGDK